MCLLSAVVLHDVYDMKWDRYVQVIVLISSFDKRHAFWVSCTLSDRRIYLQKIDIEANSGYLGVDQSRHKPCMGSIRARVKVLTRKRHSPRGSFLLVIQSHEEH